MKFIFQFIAATVGKARPAAFHDHDLVDQHHDPIVPVPHGPLLSILTSTY